MLNVEIIPELALRSGSWEFVLGMPLQQVIEIMRKEFKVMSNIDFWYSDKSPFSFNILLNLPNDGLRLHFDSKCQRLMLIEITDLSKITLSYWSQYFNSPSKLPSLQEIIRIFGSTKKLLPDTNLGDFRLCYRGIMFMLTSPSTVDAGINRGPPWILNATASPVCSATSADLGQVLDSVESQLIVKRIYIFIGQNVFETRLPSELPSSCYHGNIFLERLQVVRSGDLTKHISMDLVCQELSVNPNQEPAVKRFTTAIAFGDSVQDILSALGSPSRVFYKTEDKMKIHLPQPYRQNSKLYLNFFFNYFCLGLDILFDFQTKSVISVILHTNQPGEYTFNTYYRCMFEIPIRIQDNDLEEKSFTVTPFVKWRDIKPFLVGTIPDEPVVIHRETTSRKNPFWSTHAYGYKDIIFEVLPQNDYLGSVTLYSLPENMQTQ